MCACIFKSLFLDRQKMDISASCMRKDLVCVVLKGEERSGAGNFRMVLVCFVVCDLDLSLGNI